MEIEKREKVSVILPVFNREKELGKCLDTICAQTYQNLEIILVDDGSTDGTREVCLAYGKKDARIRYAAHKENGGVSKARNTGLSHATGTYLYFVDDDDFMKEEMLEHLVAGLQEAQMVICNYYRLFSGKAVANGFCEKPGIYTVDAYLQATIKDPGHHYYGVLWNKIFLREIVEKHHLRFREDVSLGEDFIFNLEYVSKVERVKVLKEPWYYYNRGGISSLSRPEEISYKSCREELNNRLKIYEVYEGILKKRGLLAGEQVHVEDYWVRFYIRQQYVLRFQAGGFKEEEKQQWREELEHLPVMQSAIGRLPKRTVFLKKETYALLALCKYFVKKLFL